jgi:prolyl 4-hydroxylase
MNNMQILSERPFIASLLSSLTEEQLDQLAQIKIDQRSTVGHHDEVVREDPSRTSSSYYATDHEYIHISEMIVQDINLAFNRNYTTKSIETIQFTKYEEGEYFWPHIDFHNQNLENPVTNRDRIATALLYLNDDFEGGYTTFPKLDIQFKPQKGMILFFEYPPSDDLSTNLLTLHEGQQVVKGTKIIATQWFLDNNGQKQFFLKEKHENR